MLEIHSKNTNTFYKYAATMEGWSVRRKSILSLLQISVFVSGYVAWSIVSCYIVWRGGPGVGKALCLGYKHNQ